MKKKIVSVGSLWDTYRAASNAKGLRWSLQLM